MRGEKDCYVYIIGHVIDGIETGPVKIGIADNPWSRVVELQTGNHWELRVVHAFLSPSRLTARTIERACHVRFKDAHLRGEWFDLEPIEAMSRMCACIRLGVELNNDFDEDYFEQVMEKVGVIAAEKIVAAGAHQGSQVVQ